MRGDTAAMGMPIKMNPKAPPKQSLLTSFFISIDITFYTLIEF